MSKNSSTRVVRLLTAALLTAVGVVAVGATTEAANAAGSKKLAVSYSKVMKNETFKVSGQLSTAVARPIRIQFKSDGKWHNTSTSGTTLSGGSFKFFIHTSKTRTFRFYAPKATVDSHTYGSITGDSRPVKVVAQKVTEIKVVNDSQCHFGPISLEPVTVFVEFYPARWGRGVTVLTSTNGTVPGAEDRHGRVAISFTPPATNGNYTAVATAASESGEASFSSKSVGYKVTTCVLTPL